jgi:hypothetical protein
MVVTIFPEGRTRLGLRARPTLFFIAVTLLIVGGGAFWITRHLETTDRQAVVLPEAWTWAVTGVALVGAIGVILNFRIACILDTVTSQITIERGWFRKKRVCVPLAQVERIAIRQRGETSNDYDGGGPEELRPVRTTLVLALILKTGEEITVVPGMPGGAEGMALVRQLEKFRKGL